MEEASLFARPGGKARDADNYGKSRCDSGWLGFALADTAKWHQL